MFFLHIMLSGTLYDGMRHVHLTAVFPVFPQLAIRSGLVVMTPSMASVCGMYGATYAKPQNRMPKTDTPPQTVFPCHHGFALKHSGRGMVITGRG